MPQSYRVLLIDDRRDALMPAERMLQMLGHEVATAMDGPAGLAKAREFSPEVVLCDIGLAGQLSDGAQLAYISGLAGNGALNAAFIENKNPIR